MKLELDQWALCNGEIWHKIDQSGISEQHFNFERSYFPRFEQFYNFSSIEIAIFARKLHWIQWGCVLYRSFKLLVFINFHHFTWTCRLFNGFLWLCTPGLQSKHHYFIVKEMVAWSCEFHSNISRRAYALDCLQYAIYLPEISTLPNLSQEKRIFCISKVFNFPSHHILSLGPSSFFKTKTCWLQPVFQSGKWKEKNIITFLDDC